MSSSRLPGKVLLEINGRPMLSYMLERVSFARKIENIIIATSTDPSDDPIAELCRKEKVLFYRGSLEDVLTRYFKAAETFKAKTIVRLTSDCPLIDPAMIDLLVDIYSKGNYDYVANTMPPSWTVPVGMDVEVFSFEKLKQLWQEVKDKADREHVTFHFWKNPDRFKLFRYNLKVDLSHFRLTVDYPEDFEVVKAIFTHLYLKDSQFGLKDIIDFLKANPKIKKLNENVTVSKGWRSAYFRKKQENYLR